MKQVTRAFIAAGGHGTRMRQYLEIQGVKSKSLIQVGGRSILYQLVSEVRELVHDLAVASNHPVNLFEELPLERPSVEVIYDEGVGPACYPTEFASEPFYFLYGHSMTTKKHLRKMSMIFTDKGLVCSGFLHTSEHRPVVAKVKNNQVILKKQVTTPYTLAPDEMFIEPPFIFSPAVAKTVLKFNKAGERKVNPVILNADSSIIRVVVSPKFPPEFHYEHELDELKRFIKLMTPKPIGTIR